MGFRFRKSFGTGPVRINISKSGIGYSVGAKGARITKKANGNTMTTVGIPGTGISHTKEYSKKSNKNKNGANNMNFNELNPSRTYDYITDPATIDVPTRPNFIYLIKTLLFYLALNFIVIIAAALLDFSAGAVGFCLIISMIVLPVITTSKWRKKFLPLKKPKHLDIWLKEMNIPSAFQKITSSLTEAQKSVYITILEFLNYGEEEDKTFTIADLNATLDNPINGSVVTKLYELGYLVKPSRGCYALNKVKIDKLKEEISKTNKINEERYQAFCSECKEYNEQAKAYNERLIKKRLKK